MEFKGSKEYVSTDDLSIAVNAAINLEKPLLVKGEPGPEKLSWQDKYLKV